MLLPALCFAKVSPTEAKAIYDRIVQANNITDAPKLYYDGRDIINAYTYEDGKGAIVIFKGILDRYNTNEIALVLAHELGHWHNRGHEKPFFMEYVSDRYGFYASQKAGYNPCLGAHILWTFGNEASKTHPPGHERWRVLTLHCGIPTPKDISVYVAH